MFPARVNLFISLKTEDAKTGLLGSVFVTSGKLIIILAGFSSLFMTIPLQISHKVRLILSNQSQTTFTHSADSKFLAWIIKNWKLNNILLHSVLHVQLYMYYHKIMNYSWSSCKRPPRKSKKWLWLKLVTYENEVLKASAR